MHQPSFFVCLIAVGLGSAALCACDMTPVSDLPHAFVAGWQGESVCEIVFESDALRIGRCDFPAGVGHDAHYHNPHFGYSLTEGTMRIVDDEGTQVHDIPAGRSWSSDTITHHEVLNVGNTTASYLIVEPR